MHGATKEFRLLSTALNNHLSNEKNDATLFEGEGVGIFLTGDGPWTIDNGT